MAPTDQCLYRARVPSQHRTLVLTNAHVAGRDSRFMPQSPTIKTRLATACTLCGHGKSWHRTWVPRLWDQVSRSDDPLRPAETAPLPGRRRDHRAVLTIDGLLQGNRYKAGLRSNHPYIAHRSLQVSTDAGYARGSPFSRRAFSRCSINDLYRSASSSTVTAPPTGSSCPDPSHGKRSSSRARIHSTNV